MDVIRKQRVTTIEKPEWSRGRNVLDFIGNTPMVEMIRLSKIKKIGEARILLKLEGFNPGGSIKDRIAKFMVEEAEKRGELTRGKIILEATSGNTGIGLTLVARIKRYRVHLVMSDKKSLERRLLIRLLGANLKLITCDDPDTPIREAEKMAAKSDRYFYINQNENNDNWRAHYYTTALEILQQVDSPPDVLVAGVGTGGTLMGCSRRLREVNPNLKVFSVEPLHQAHKLEGLKNLDAGLYVPRIYNPGMIDGVVKIRDEDAIQTARQLAICEGILAGLSSGAVAHAAIQIARQVRQGTIVAILADGADKYFTTDLFGGLKGMDDIYDTYLSRIARGKISNRAGHQGQ
jgi:cysteine synthase